MWVFFLYLVFILGHILHYFSIFANIICIPLKRTPVSFESLKLTAPLTANLETLAFTVPKPIQAKVFTRIKGGQDMIIVGPEGSGKSTLFVLSVIAQLKFAFEMAPRALFMVPTKEKGIALETYLRDLGTNMNLRVAGMYNHVDIEYQRELLRDGLDIVIGTPDRILALYIRSGINLTKLKFFIIEDAEEIIKQNQQVIIKNIADNLGKCQHLMSATETSDKLSKLGGYFLINPLTVYCEE